MMKISKLADYSVQILVKMSEEAGLPLSAHFLAEQTGLGLPTVQKVLKQLALADILDSMRGSQGGYVLSRAPEAISMAGILAAVDGYTGLTDCSAGEVVCARYDACTVRTVWDHLSHCVDHLLEAVTLRDVMKPCGLAALDIQLSSCLGAYKKEVTHDCC